MDFSKSENENITIEHLNYLGFENINGCFKIVWFDGEVQFTNGSFWYCKNNKAIKKIEINKDINDIWLEQRRLSRSKPFFIANVREVLDLHQKEQISFSKMVELLNAIAIEWQNQGRRIEAGNVMCILCGNKWIAVRPESVDKLECKNCKIISTIQRID